MCIFKCPEREKDLPQALHLWIFCPALKSFIMKSKFLLYLTNFFTNMTFTYMILLLFLELKFFFTSIFLRLVKNSNIIYWFDTCDVQSVIYRHHLHFVLYQYTKYILRLCKFLEKLVIFCQFLVEKIFNFLNNTKKNSSKEMKKRKLTHLTKWWSLVYGPHPLVAPSHKHLWLCRIPKWLLPQNQKEDQYKKKKKKRRREWLDIRWHYQALNPGLTRLSWQQQPTIFARQIQQETRR